MFYSFFLYVHVLFFYLSVISLFYINPYIIVYIYLCFFFYWNYFPKLFLNFYWIIMIFMIYFKKTQFFNTFYFKPSFNWRRALRLYFISVLDFIKYVTKKYVYTINHKRIAINYLVFCM